MRLSGDEGGEESGWTLCCACFARSMVRWDSGVPRVVPKLRGRAEASKGCGDRGPSGGRAAVEGRGADQHAKQERLYGIVASRFQWQYGGSRNAYPARRESE